MLKELNIGRVLVKSDQHCRNENRKNVWRLQPSHTANVVLAQNDRLRTRQIVTRKRQPQDHAADDEEQDHATVAIAQAAGDATLFNLKGKIIRSFYMGCRIKYFTSRKNNCP